jgi:hypothetical protein
LITSVLFRFSPSVVRSVPSANVQAQTKRQTDRQADRQTERQTDRQTEKPIDRQTDRETNRQTDRQAMYLCAVQVQSERGEVRAKRQCVEV